MIQRREKEDEKMDHLPEQEAQHVIYLLTRLFLYAYQKRNKKVIVTPENLEHLCHMGSKLVFQNDKMCIRDRNKGIPSPSQMFVSRYSFGK